MNGVSDEGFFASLVDVADFTDDETMLARWLVSQIRYGAKMRQGLLVEAHLARLLGAQLPTLGNTPWDLKLPDGRLVEVKSFGTSEAIALGQSKRVDLWIFVAKGEANDLSGARYYVAEDDDIRRLFGDQSSVASSKVQTLFGPGLDRPGLAKRLASSPSI